MHLHPHITKSPYKTGNSAIKTAFCIQRDSQIDLLQHSNQANCTFSICSTCMPTKAAVDNTAAVSSQKSQV